MFASLLGVTGGGVTQYLRPQAVYFALGCLWGQNLPNAFRVEFSFSKYFQNRGFCLTFIDVNCFIFL